MLSKTEKFKKLMLEKTALLSRCQSQEDITISPEVTDYALSVGIILKMKPIFYFIVQDIHHLETTFSVK